MSEVGDRQRAATVDPELVSIPMNISRITTRSGRSYDSGTPTPMVAGGLSSTSGFEISGHEHLRPEQSNQHAQPVADDAMNGSTQGRVDDDQQRDHQGSDSTPVSTAAAIYKTLGTSGQEMLGRVASSLRGGGKAREHPGGEQRSGAAVSEGPSERLLLLRRIHKSSCRG